MLSENAIEVKGISKTFKVYYDKGTTLKEKVLFERRRKYETRTVLDNISFQVKKGEAIGLIGHNGCGKSTTLKLLTRIMYPDSGSIEIKGRVSSLIELGAGFHPDMTGRENIYINAAIFGLTRKEIDERLQTIIDFSELHDFIDNPVRTYSSGMYMRLAFSVAINVDADVLLIDEILGVGDANFQVKCFNKLKEIKKKGTTIVIVSHSLNQIEQICERSLWLQDGRVREEGMPKAVHEHYLNFMFEKNPNNKNEEQINLTKDDVYDCVISLGFSSQVTYQLERLGLQGIEYPFDWAFSFDMNKVIQAIDSDFLDWFKKENLIEEESPTRFRKLIDKKYGIIHQHIFPKDRVWEESFDSIEKVMNNRIKNMLSMKGKKVLFVRTINNNDIEKIKNLESTLLNKYGDNIHLLVLKHTKKMQLIEHKTKLKHTDIYEVYQEEELELTRGNERAAWKGCDLHYDRIFQNIQLKERYIDLWNDKIFIDFWQCEKSDSKGVFRWTKPVSSIDLREFIGCTCKLYFYSPRKNKIKICDAEKKEIKEFNIDGNEDALFEITYDARFVNICTEMTWIPKEFDGSLDNRKLGVCIKKMKIIRKDF